VYVTWGSYWYESGPNEWSEYTGLYYTQYETYSHMVVYFPCGQGGKVVGSPCNSLSYVNCPPHQPNNGPLEGGSAQLSQSFAGVKCKNCLAVASPTALNISLFQVKGKKLFAFSTLTTGGEVPVNLAVSAEGTIYASVVSTASSGPPPGIVYYLAGDTSPAGTLSDANMTDDGDAIAVDPKGDVFVSYTEQGTGEASDQIDEFPEGKSTAVSFATIDGAQALSLTVTKKGEIVAGSIGASSSQVTTFSKSGTPVATFKTSSYPDSISLDKANKNLFVVDSSDDLISQYAYPSGKLISSGQLETKEGAKLLPVTVEPYNPPKV
jgi:hypothetical protein